MEFAFTEEQLGIQRKIRDCCQREIAPGARDLDVAPMERTLEMIRERTVTLAREGLLGLGFPVEKGGAGGGLLSAVSLHQELGEVCTATALSVLSSVGLCARALYEWGEGSERDAFLPGLLGGEKIGAWGSIEPEASLDEWGFKTMASPTGSGYRLGGKKSMVLNAPVSALKVLTASANGVPALFLVVSGAKGIETGAPQVKMGCRGVPTADLTLEDCPAVRLGHGNGEGSVVALRSFEHLLFGAVATGVIKAAMVAAGIHARDRRAGDQALGRHQEISFKLADTLLFHETALMLLNRCVWMMEEKNPEAPVLCSSAKVFASESAARAAEWAVQITGQEGYCDDSHAGRLYRDAKLLEILGDRTEKHRMFIADRVLDLY